MSTTKKDQKKRNILIRVAEINEKVEKLKNEKVRLFKDLKRLDEPKDLTPKAKPEISEVNIEKARIEFEQSSVFKNQR